MTWATGVHFVLKAVFTAATLAAGLAIISHAFGIGLAGDLATAAVIGLPGITLLAASLLPWIARSRPTAFDDRLPDRQYFERSLPRLVVVTAWQLFIIDLFLLFGSLTLVLPAVFMIAIAKGDWVAVVLLPLGTLLFAFMPIAAIWLCVNLFQNWRDRKYPIAVLDERGIQFARGGKLCWQAIGKVTNNSNDVAAILVVLPVNFVGHPWPWRTIRRAIRLVGIEALKDEDHDRLISEIARHIDRTKQSNANLVAS